MENMPQTPQSTCRDDSTSWKTGLSPREPALRAKASPGGAALPPCTNTHTPLSCTASTSAPCETDVYNRFNGCYLFTYILVH